MGSERSHAFYNCTFLDASFTTDLDHSENFLQVMLPMETISPLGAFTSLVIPNRTGGVAIALSGCVDWNGDSAH
jgi:hypothetical protein